MGKEHADKITVIRKGRDLILKFNPYHGYHGYFSSRDAHTDFSPGKGAQRARSIEAENKRRIAEGNVMLVAGEYTIRLKGGKAMYAEAKAWSKANGKWGLEKPGGKYEPKDDKDTINGVKKGDPMTHEEADSGKVNPDYATDRKFQVNCQTCVYAYVARRLGYDVKAIGRDDTNDDQNKRTYGHDEHGFINKSTGKPPEPIENPTTIRTYKQTKKWLSDSLGEGEMATFSFKWRGYNSGHIIMASKHNGQVEFYDPQSNKTVKGEDVDAYLRRVQPNVSVPHTGLKFPRLKLTKIDLNDIQLDNNIASKLLDPTKKN
ncbi:MAG: toxin glutamine deamidase domain-containing protein [Lachnospiraceae bacterium]|nr:toxin glutamine deamidase domain-containing protein [Lachnospiraceae bacterium]